MVKFMTFLVLLYKLKKLLRKLYESAIYLHRIIGVWVAVGFKWKMLKYYLKGLNYYECSKFGVNFLLSSDIDLYKLYVPYKLITHIFSLSIKPAHSVILCRTLFSSET